MAESLVRVQARVAAGVAQTLRGRWGLGAPVRRSFVQSPGGDGSPSPMVQVISAGARARGGPGGKVRLGLLLSALWIAGARDPYDTVRTPSMWAELLGMPEPTTAGARSIRNAHRVLADKQFFREPAGPGREARRIQLLREDGSGRDYSIPTGQKDQGDMYFRAPEALWTQGIIARLETPGLVMLLAALSISSWDAEAHAYSSVVFRPKTTRDHFGVADSTRKRGLQELSEQGLLLDLSGKNSPQRVEGLPRNESKRYRINSVLAPGTPSGTPAR